MANNYFINNLGISNILVNNEGNYFSSYSLTFYYRIRRSQVLWEYTNPDIKITLNFSDGTKFTPGWKTKQGDAGNYNYEGDDGIGNYTIELRQSYFKTISSVLLEARKSSSTNSDADFNIEFNFTNGRTFYKNIYFSNKQVSFGESFQLVGNGLHPEKQIMTTSTSPKVEGVAYRGINSEIYFGDKIKIYRPTTFSYLGRTSLTPTKIEVYKNNEAIPFYTFNSTSTNNYITFTESTKLLGKIDFKVVFYVGDNGTYVYTTTMYQVDSIKEYLDLSELIIQPNSVVGENFNEGEPFDIRLRTSGIIKTNIGSSFPFTIDKITCSINDEQQTSVFDIFSSATNNWIDINFQSIEYFSINKPTEIQLRFYVTSFLNEEVEKIYEYDYNINKIQEVEKIISIRGITYSIEDIYTNKTFLDGIPVLLKGETLELSNNETCVYDPNNRGWISEAQIKFYINNEDINGTYSFNKDILQTYSTEIIPRYEYDNITISGAFQQSLFVQMGRTQKIKVLNAYIQDNELFYILSDNGGDQSSEVSSSQFLEGENSLFRGVEQTLSLALYLNGQQQDIINLQINDEIALKSYLKQNTKNVIQLSSQYSGLDGISFSYNGITSEIFELVLKDKNPTFSFRKNGFIVNGQPNQQLEEDEFIQINSLDKTKGIRINFYDESGVVATGQIIFNDGKIVLKNIYISSEQIV